MESNDLSAKLSELDRTLSHLHETLAGSQRLDAARLRGEIDKLRSQNCGSRAALHEKMHGSRAPLVGQLEKTYTEVEQLVAGICAQDAARSADEQLLLAEYALDFALQAAGQATLLSLQAIETQQSEEELTT